MALYTRAIKAPKRNGDGKRISVMSRHTLRDGKTPDPEITNEMYDEWRKELGPPPKLIGAYYRHEISWDEFARSFREYLALPSVESLLRDLITLAHNSSVTILCVEDTPEYCHRRLIAEQCSLLNSTLTIIIE